MQRISIGYLFASVLEIWLVNNVAVDSAITFVKRYCIQWYDFVFWMLWFVTNDDCNSSSHSPPLQKKKGKKGTGFLC